jgi:hypothetical protein
VALKLGSLAFRLAHGLKVRPWAESFFLACDCVKCLVLKGFASCQYYSVNLFLSYWHFLLAIFSPCFTLLSLPVNKARQQQPNQRYEMKTKLDLPREIEIPTADLWLSTGAITITETGEENTYYVNEFGHKFFCKNYPSHDCQAQIYI